MLLNFARPQLAPNIVSAPKNNVDVDSLLGLTNSQYDGLQSVGDTGYYYGNNRMYEPYTITVSQPTFGFGGYYLQPPQSNRAAGTIEVGSQAFRPVSEDVAGFTKTKGENDIYDYAPSMAYVYANTPRPAPVQTPNVTSFLSSPTMPSYSGNYGAGRFLNTGNLLGFNFGTPSGQTAGGETTA
jgi:hypothetical protein